MVRIRVVLDTCIIPRKCVEQYWRECTKKAAGPKTSGLDCSRHTPCAVTELPRNVVDVGDGTRSVPATLAYAAAADTPATNGSRYLLRTGFCSLATALASICRTRSRVTLKIRPTSSSV